MSNTRLQLLLLASFAVAGSRSFILGSSWVPRSRVGVVPRAEPPNSRGDTPHLESGGAGGTPPSARPTPPPPQKPAKVAPKGIFAPVVEGAKCILGEKELNELRAKVIGDHSKVISAFVDTSESKFGRIALKALFEAADEDHSGALDKLEVRRALKALGFTWIDEKKAETLVGRADVNDDAVIDFEEFVREAPKTLRTNLIKLAKKNGHDLGFLA